MSNHRHPRKTTRQAESAHSPLSLADLKADPERLFTQTEVGKILGKSPSWFERQRWSKTGPMFFKIGRSVLYRASDLLDFVEGGAVTTTRDARAPRATPADVAA